MKIRLLLAVVTTFVSSVSFAQSRGDVISTELLVSWTPEEQKNYMLDKLGTDLPIDQNLVNLILDVLSEGIYSNDINIYKVRYWTHDLSGSMVQATGAMTVPQSTNGKTMIIFGRGHIYDEADVLSNLRSGGGSNLFAMAYSMTDFITLVPDYIGCGDGEGREKAFNHNEGANAMVDMYRAGLSITNTMGINRNGQVFVGGYSQGGGNAMATIKYLTETGLLWNELPVHNSIFGGGPYDFGNTTLNYSMSIEESIDPEYYFMYVRGAKDAGYNVYDNPHDKIIPEYWDEWDYYIENDIIRKENIPTLWKGLFTPEAIQELSDPSGPLFEYAKTLDVYDWDNHISMLLTYGKADTEVPFMNSIIARNTIRDNVPWYNFWRRWIINTRDFGADVDHRGAGAFTLLNSLVEFGLHRNAHDVVNKNVNRNKRAPSTLLVQNRSAIQPQLRFHTSLKTKKENTISDVKVTSLSSSDNFKKTNIKGKTIDMSSFDSGFYIVEAKIDGVRTTELYYRPKLELITQDDESYYYPLQKEKGVWNLDLNDLEVVSKVNVFNSQKQLIASIDPKGRKEITFNNIVKGSHIVEVITPKHVFYLDLDNRLTGASGNEIMYLKDSFEVVLKIEGTNVNFIEVFNIQGKLVQSIAKPDILKRTSLSSLLNNGVYIVRAALDNGKSLTKKIIID